MDRLNVEIIRTLLENGRITSLELAETVGLSPTACARRVHQLEDSGVIAGYRANLSMEELGYKTTVMVTFTLDRQTDGVMERFEQAISECPSVMWCYLMSGTSDYIACIMARDIADFERIHKEQLCRLPSVAMLQSNFALRKIVQRSVPMSFG
jgi:DNA-binding Lrp family transcriptional regulator